MNFIAAFLAGTEPGRRPIWRCYRWGGPLLKHVLIGDGRQQMGSRPIGPVTLPWCSARKLSGNTTRPRAKEEFKFKIAQGRAVSNPPISYPHKPLSRLNCGDGDTS